MSVSEPILGNTTKFASLTEAFAEKYGDTALRFYLQAVTRELLPNERIAICWRYLLPQAEGVEIIYSAERKRARARGTMKCGSVWLCAVCSAYITERRRLELQEAIERARDTLFPVMITYTVQHSAQQNLSDLLDEMHKAFRRMKSGKVWQEIKSEWFMVGSVRATEITYGDAGWHPHYHELLFADLGTLQGTLSGDVEQYAQSLQTQLSKLWVATLEKFNLKASTARGVDVKAAGGDIAAYIMKYGRMPSESKRGGISGELALGPQKRARGANLSVYDLIFAAGENNKNAKNLVKQYAEATKGKSQLQWSRGLKALLHIEEIKDELAAEGVETDTDVLLASISRFEWKWLTDAGFTAQLMTIANTGDAGELVNFLNRLRAKMPQVELVDFSGF